MTVRAMKAGAAEFLSKPFDDQVLLDAIHAAIERDRARRRDAASLAVLTARYEELTERERQVMRKMLAKSVAELVRMADRLGPLGAA